MPERGKNNRGESIITERRKHMEEHNKASISCGGKNGTEVMGQFASEHMSAQAGEH